MFTAEIQLPDGQLWHHTLSDTITNWGDALNRAISIAATYGTLVAVRKKVT
jgi:hypothetical protein